MNRREFLKGATASVAGAAVGGCATAGGAAAKGLVSATYDVAVMGGGPAGVCAAIVAMIAECARYEALKRM